MREHKIPDIDSDLQKLVTGWCDRRALVALYHFLPGFIGYERSEGNFRTLEISLKDVLNFENEITSEESTEIRKILRLIQSVIYK